MSSEEDQSQFFDSTFSNITDVSGTARIQQPVRPPIPQFKIPPEMDANKIKDTGTDPVYQDLLARFWPFYTNTAQTYKSAVHAYAGLMSGYVHQTEKSGSNSEKERLRRLIGPHRNQVIRPLKINVHDTCLIFETESLIYKKFYDVSADKPPHINLTLEEYGTVGVHLLQTDTEPSFTTNYAWHSYNGFEFSLTYFNYIDYHQRTVPYGDWLANGWRIKLNLDYFDRDSVKVSIYETQPQEEKDEAGQVIEQPPCGCVINIKGLKDFETKTMWFNCSMYSKRENINCYPMCFPDKSQDNNNGTGGSGGGGGGGALKSYMFIDIPNASCLT